MAIAYNYIAVTYGYIAVALSHIVANGHKPWLMAISRQNQHFQGVCSKSRDTPAVWVVVSTCLWLSTHIHTPDDYLQYQLRIAILRILVILSSISVAGAHWSDSKFVNRMFLASGWAAGGLIYMLLPWDTPRISSSNCWILSSHPEAADSVECKPVSFWLHCVAMRQSAWYLHAAPWPSEFAVVMGDSEAQRF